MIQRIQTIYLFFAFVILLLMYFFPLAEFLSGQHELYYFYIDGIKPEGALEGHYFQKTLPVFILLSIVCLVVVISIFLFKKRILQMRLCIFSVLLLVGLCGLMAFYFLNAKNRLEAIVHYNYPLVFPVVTIILIYLAFRGIRKDELLVRSYERIR